MIETNLRGILAAALTAALLLSGCGGGGGDGAAAPPPQPTTPAFTDPTVYSSAANASLPSAAEITAVTHHRLVLDGASLDYTATVGHLTSLALGSGAPQASFFYVAYTLDGAAPATRPVTFFYNGGPGSATVWLHLGSFGPKRLTAGVPSGSVPPPFPLVDNEESLLDLSDLVFVDAVGSGYSQGIAPNSNRTFWGVDADGAAFRDFVMRYVAVNSRGASAKFLFGESYGGPRTAVLADLLESAGVRLAGLVLQSPAMNYNSNCSVSNAGGIGCAGFHPSYAATGAWHNRATPSPPAAQIPQHMVLMRELAGERYAPALTSFMTLGTPPQPALLAELSATTGLSLTQWQGNFNMQPEYLRVNLIPGTLLGRYDARISAPNFSAPGREIDPSDTLISTSFGFRITEYLTSLGYTTPSSYVMLGNAIQNWNFSHDGRGLPDTIPDLAAALMQNPRLKVLALNGYHDLATPFFTTESDLMRLGADPRVQVRNYLGGHMTYLDDGSRRLQKADLAQFYRSALAN